MRLFITLLIIIYSLIFPSQIFAQEETFEAQVIEVLEEKEITPEYSQDVQLYQRLRLLVTKGSLASQHLEVESGTVPMVNLPAYKVGDKVIIGAGENPAGQKLYTITDYVRRDSLLLLFALFALLTLIIGKWKGMSSLLGMGASFIIIFSYILPTISAGADPVFTAIIGSILIIPLTFYLSHGFNNKTSAAIVGTVLALIITGILASFAVNAAFLTGFASEEASFLQVAKGGTVNLRGLLLAGIIIGVLGVLDDITISQSAIVQQLRETKPKLKSKELYQKAMTIGKDHIASMVNTLILVYTGAALPLLLLFIDNPRPFWEVVNYEIIADEIVRTLVGSIGLVIAVPITTLIAIAWPYKQPYSKAQQ